MEKFSTKFQKIVATYNERTSVEDLEKIIQEMINLKNEIEQELKAGNEPQSKHFIFIVPSLYITFQSMYDISIE